LVRSDAALVGAVLDFLDRISAANVTLLKLTVGVDLSSTFGCGDDFLPTGSPKEVTLWTVKSCGTSSPSRGILPVLGEHISEGGVRAGSALVSGLWTVFSMEAVLDWIEFTLEVRDPLALGDALFFERESDPVETLAASLTMELLFGVSAACGCVTIP
jgi:hypothetical protein